MTQQISRRRFCKLSALGIVSVPLGCTNNSSSDFGVDNTTTGSIMVRPQISIDPAITSSKVMYAELQDGSYHIPAIPFEKVDQKFRRQRVANHARLPVGDVLIDTKQHFAYLIVGKDEAVRYGIGIGKAGFEWSGSAVIGRKAKWPTWTPPKEMIARKPILAKYSGGMPGGLDNPLGARALYLYKDGVDTLYRLHGTPEWDTIGKSMSSGCIRFMNQDIIDLYNRISKNSTVVVV